MSESFDWEATSYTEYVYVSLQMILLLIYDEIIFKGNRGRQAMVETKEPQRPGWLRPVQHPGCCEDRGTRGGLQSGDLL